MNWVLISVGAVIALGFLIGVYKGAIKIVISLVTTIVTLIIVTIATPFVAKIICEFTPLDDMIKSEISSTMADAASSQIFGEGGMSEDEVRGVLEAAGVGEEQLEQYGISIADIASGEVTGDDLAKFGISSSVLDGLENKENMEDIVEDAEIPRDMQVAAIEKADLPESFKNLLSINNNSEIYEELGVKTFAQYVGEFLSKLIINIVSFLCTFILVTIILRAIVFALDIFDDLPVFGFVNHLAGGAVGILCAVVIVWVLFVGVTLLYITSAGKEIYDAIQGNGILKMLYDYNPIMKLATKI